MSVITWKNMWNYFQHHRRKLFISGSLIGSIIVIQKYLKYKLSEWEFKQTQDLLDRMKRKHHFEGTLETCNSTTTSMVCKIREKILNMLNSEALIQHLKTGPANKIQIWDNLKIIIFSEIISELYCECLFTVALRIQLCIIGGYIYLDSVNDKNIRIKKPSATPEIQQWYLSHISHFLNDGINKLISTIKNTVKSAICNINLKHMLMLKDFQIIFDNLKHCFCSEQYFIPATSFYILSDTDTTNNNNSFLKQMINETKDVFESEDFALVMSHCLDRGFAVIMDRLSECYVLLNQEKCNFENPNNIAIPMAKILPAIHQLVQQYKPNEQGSFVPLLLHSVILTDFSANIYETFSHLNL